MTLTAEQEAYKGALRVAAEHLQRLRRSCPHFVETSRYVAPGDPSCAICWQPLFTHYCHRAPDRVCHYRSEQGQVRLLDGGLVAAPAGHAPAPASTEVCMYCGLPKTRPRSRSRSAALLDPEPGPASMTPEQMEHKHQLTEARHRHDQLLRECPHHVEPNDRPDPGSASCAICGKRFGWYCGQSPDRTCHYFSDDGHLHLIDGTRLEPGEDYDASQESAEWCLFCMQPKERK